MFVTISNNKRQTREEEQRYLIADSSFSEVKGNFEVPRYFVKFISFAFRQYRIRTVSVSCIVECIFLGSLKIRKFQLQILQNKMASNVKYLVSAL